MSVSQTPKIGSQASRLARDLTLAGQTATRIPKLIYGTAWKKERTADLVYTALKNGFRGIDTAAQPKHYDEQGVAAGVKKAVADGLVKRADLFVTLSPRRKSSATGNLVLIDNITDPNQVYCPRGSKPHCSVRPRCAASRQGPPIPTVVAEEFHH